MSLPGMRDFKCKYTNNKTGFIDIINEFETQNLEVIRSKITFRLNTFKGEFEDNPDFGLSLTETKKNSQNQDGIIQLIANEILAVENVQNASVSSSNFSESDRILTTTFDVKSKYGNLKIQQVT